jgi:hypothetical protein
MYELVKKMTLPGWAHDSTYVSQPNRRLWPWEQIPKAVAAHRPAPTYLSAHRKGEGFLCRTAPCRRVADTWVPP